MFIHRTWEYQPHAFDESLLAWALPGGPLPPELVAVLLNRGFNSEVKAAGFLSPEHYHPTNPSELPGLSSAVSLMIEALQQSARILVWGDSDVDGQTATVLLVEMLAKQGCVVSFHIPSTRQLTASTINVQLNHYRPELLIMCDTGTRAVDAFQAARTTGTNTLIFDHHQPSEQLPPVDALVNPALLPNATHPLITLSAAGVTYLVAQEYLTLSGYIGQPDNLLELAALALIADAVEQVQDTRYLIQLGLSAMRRSTRPAIQLLCSHLQINQARLTAQDVAFKIVPVLNALGRLENPEKALELLIAKNQAEAEQLVLQGIGHNRRRQALARQTIASIEEEITENPSLLEWDALVFNSPNWDRSVLSSVASQLTNTYQKPVALLISPEDQIASGSIRSVAGYHVTRALDQIGDILLSYGGHPLAGGVSIAPENVPMFRRLFSQAIADTREPTASAGLAIEYVLPFERLTLDFAHQVQRLAPFGNGNPNPIFVSRNLSLLRSAKIGANNQHRRLTIQDEQGQQQRVFWWNNEDLSELQGRFDLAYQIEVTSYEGEESLQLTLMDFRQIESSTAEIYSGPEIIDCRSHTNPLALIEQLQIQEHNIQVWAEGFPSAKSPGKPFSQLLPAHALLVVTAPSSQQQLIAGIEKIRPRRLYLLAAYPPIRDMAHYLVVLQQLCEKVIEKHQGQTTIEQLTERLAQPEHLLRLALAYLQETQSYAAQIGRKNITLTRSEKTTSETESAAAIYQKLQQLWDEVAAYRRYLQQAPVEHIME
jgi:single-stranded-DNA-specific exonuclease